MKILFITAYFYPENVIATSRIGGFAKYLSYCGYDVVVITTKKYPILPLDYCAKDLGNVKIIEVDYLPKAIQKLLINEFNTLSSTRRYNPNLSRLKQFIKKSIKEWKFKLGTTLDIYNLWIEKGFKKAYEIMKKEKFDYIFSSFSPAASHVISSKIKKIFPEVKWIADFRDLWAYNHVINLPKLIKFHEINKEKKTLKNVDLIITVSDALKETIKKLYPNKIVTTVENGFNPEEFPNWKKNLSSYPRIDKKLVISYTGRIYRRKQDPSLLFQAINELIKEDLIRKNQIEINFYGPNVEEIYSIINSYNYNIYGNIKINGFVSRKEALQIQRNSDLLLFLEWNDPSARGVYTGKIFEYIVSGTPILGIGINFSNAAGNLIVKSGTGILVNNKEILKSVLLKIIRNRVIDFYNPKIEIIKNFSRDRLTQKLIKYMENL